MPSGFEKQSSISKIWDFLWKSDSPASWIADLIIAFVIIKFIFFPLMSMLFSSALPFVIVESTSMKHDYDYDGFWNAHGSFYEELNISKEQFENFSFKNGFDKGDIMLIKGQDEYKVGDVIVFQTDFQSTPIIHRIISVKKQVYSTKGDHNFGQLIYEQKIEKKQIIGKAFGTIPWLGWLKLGFLEIFNLFIH